MFGLVRCDHLVDLEEDLSESDIERIGSVQAVAAGFEHTMILKDDGTLWASGQNSFGKLGLGDEENRDTPVEVVF